MMLRRQIERMPLDLLVARLTLLLAILNANEDTVLLGVAALATVALWTRPTLLGRPEPWLLLGAMFGLRQASSWWLIDDHVMVTTYWLVAFGLSRMADGPHHARRVAARTLVGLVFACAFGWKVLSSQFVSTEFFHFQLVTDERFAPALSVAGVDDVDELRETAAEVYAEPVGSELVVETPDRVPELSLVFTAWGIVIEGAVAVVHLLPLRRRLRSLRPVTIVVFAATTYAVVPVAGFGFLLVVLAVAGDDRPRWRAALVAFGAVIAAWGALFPLLI